MNYEINEDTLAVLYDGLGKTKIIEKEREVIVEKNPFEIMEDSCEYYGSTYEGRINSVKKMLNYSYKIPVLVEESENIIFFPTKSYLLSDCSWINYNYIKKCEKNGNKTTIIFLNDKKIDLEESKLSVNNQILKSSRLESILLNRKIAKREK